MQLQKDYERLIHSSKSRSTISLIVVFGDRPMFIRSSLCRASTRSFSFTRSVSEVQLGSLLRPLGRPIFGFGGAASSSGAVGVAAWCTTATAAFESSTGIGGGDDDDDDDDDDRASFRAFLDASKSLKSLDGFGVLIKNLLHYQRITAHCCLGVFIGVV